MKQMSLVQAGFFQTPFSLGSDLPLFLILLLICYIHSVAIRLFAEPLQKCFQSSLPCMLVKDGVFPNPPLQTSTRSMLLSTYICKLFQKAKEALNSPHLNLSFYENTYNESVLASEVSCFKNLSLPYGPLHTFLIHLFI